MFWNFVATIFAGLGGAGVALMLRSLTRKKAPKWTIPVFAGLGMLAYLVYGEYIWFEHKQSQLPEEAIVVATENDPIFWRPWSFVVPQVTRFTVLDTKSIKTETTNTAIATFYLYRFEQSYTDQVSGQVHLLNCDTRELVPVTENGQAAIKGMRTLTLDDPLYAHVCK